MPYSCHVHRSSQGPGDGVAVTLDNMKSMLSRDRGEKDLASSQCVFAQAYRQLSDTDPKLLRTVWDGERVFQVRGEEEPQTGTNKRGRILTSSG